MEKRARNRRMNKLAKRENIRVLYWIIATALIVGVIF